MFEPLKVDLIPLESVIKELMCQHENTSPIYNDLLMILYYLSISEDFGTTINKKLRDDFNYWYETIVPLGKEKNFSESQLFPSR